MDSHVYFPLELLSHILAYLSPQYLHICTTVSKSWNVLATPLLWYAPWTRYIPSWKKLIHILKHPSDRNGVFSDLPVHFYGNYIKKLDFSLLFYLVNDHFLKDFLPFVPYLHTLILTSPKQFTDCSLLTLASSPCVQETASLRKFVLENCTHYTEQGMRIFLMDAHVHGVRFETLQLTSGCRVSELILSALRPLCQSIRVLDLSHANLLTTEALARFFEPPAENHEILFPNLVRLTLTPRLVDGHVLRSLVRSYSGYTIISPPLTHLVLCDNPLTASDLIDNIPFFTNLIFLDLSRCDNINSESVLHVVGTCKKLKEIRLSVNFGNVERWVVNAVESKVWEGIHGERKVVVTGEMKNDGMGGGWMATKREQLLLGVYTSMDIYDD